MSIVKSSIFFFYIFASAFPFLLSCNSSQQHEKEAELQKQEMLRNAQEERERLFRETSENNREEQSFIVDEHQKFLDNNKKNAIMQWLQGNWEWSGIMDGYRNSCRLGVSDDYAVLATPRSVLDQGTISIDMEDNTIHFGHTYINFDYENGRLGDFSNNMYYRKMSGRSSSSSYSSSSNSYSSDSRLMTKFNKLNEEGRRLTDEIGQYYYSGQAGPWVITDVYRLKQIQDEKIGLAQEMGDRQLEALCRQL